MRTLIPLIGFLMLSTLSGCGTVLNLWTPRPLSGGVEAYGGVKADLQIAREQENAKVDGPVKQAIWRTWTAFWYLDIPASAVADTITLPLTIPAQYFWRPDIGERPNHLPWQ
jgi:uncharacterized protein YceK